MAADNGTPLRWNTSSLLKSEKAQGNEQLTSNLRNVVTSATLKQSHTKLTMC